MYFGGSVEFLVGGQQLCTNSQLSMRLKASSI